MRRGLLALLLALVLGGALAQDGETRERLESDIASYEALLSEREQQLRDIDAALQNVSAELEANIAERETVSAQLSLLRGERQGLLEQIAGLEGQLALTQADISATGARLAELRGRVQGLLQNLYRQRGGGRFAGVLRQAESFHDLQVKNHYLSLLSEQDVSLITEFNATLADLADLQNQYSAQLAELKAREETLAQNETALAETQRNLDAIIAELNTSREGQLANQGALIREQAEFERRLTDLNNNLQAELARLARIEEERRLEEERRQREAAQAAAEAAAATAQAAVAARSERQAESSAPVVVQQLSDLPPLSSDYIYPVPSPRLVRRYGELLTGGIWLQTAQEGAAVHAVQPGIVLDVSPGLANQGYIVAISHADGLVTAYVNLQEGPPVRKYQQVEQNQVIGYLGGGDAIPPDVLEFYTGWSEGNSLTWVDPARLLGF